MIGSIRRFFFNIKRLIQWSRILWNNFDFDYQYLLEIISFKLKFMEKYFRECGHTTTSLQEATEMKELIIILDRLIAEDYSENPYGKYRVVDNRNPLVFAQHIESGEYITEREFREMADKSNQQYDKDVEEFCNKLKQYRRWSD